MTNEQFKILHPKLFLISKVAEGFALTVGSKVAVSAEKELSDYLAKTITATFKHIFNGVIKFVGDAIQHYNDQSDHSSTIIGDHVYHPDTL